MQGTGERHRTVNAIQGFINRAQTTTSPVGNDELTGLRRLTMGPRIMGIRKALKAKFVGQTKGMEGAAKTEGAAKVFYGVKKTHVDSVRDKPWTIGDWIAAGDAS